MEMNVAELQTLNQNNLSNKGIVAGGSRGMESGSASFTSYLNRETESLEKRSFSAKKESSIHADEQGNERYTDVNEKETPDNKSLQTEITKAEERSRPESNDLDQHDDETQKKDLAIDNSGDDGKGSDQGNNEMYGASAHDGGTISSEAPSGGNDKETAEDNSEAIGINMVMVQQIPDENIKNDTGEANVTGEPEAEIKVAASDYKVPDPEKSQHVNEDENRIEAESDALDNGHELQTDIEELMLEEELNEAEEISVEDLSQEGIDSEGAPNSSSENNSEENIPEMGAVNQENEAVAGNNMSDRGSGQRHSDEKSGYKNPVAEAAQAVKDSIKPGTADEIEGIHAINKNIKEMMHRHSVTESAELKSGASIQSAVETETGMMHHLSSSADITSISRTGESPLLSYINRPAGITELLDSIMYAVKGNNRLGVTVEHSELGKLNINLSLDKGNVHVNIHAADKVTKEIIENNIQYIIDSLEKEGVSIGGFSVGTKEYQEKMFQSLSGRGGKIKEITENLEMNTNSNGLVSVFA